MHLCIDLTQSRVAAHCMIETVRVIPCELTPPNKSSTREWKESMSLAADSRCAAYDIPPPKKQLTASDALSMLLKWQSENVKLEFGYFRSGGGVLQTGTARILRAKPSLLTLDTEGSRLAVGLKKAKFDFGNLGLLTPDFRAVYDIEGLSIILENHDWVCLSSDASEGDLLSPAEQTIRSP